MIQSMPIYIACLPNYWNKGDENAARNNIVYNVIIYMTFVKSYHKWYYAIQGYIDEVQIIWYIEVLSISAFAVKSVFILKSKSFAKISVQSNGFLEL